MAWPRVRRPKLASFGNGSTHVAYSGPHAKLAGSFDSPVVPSLRSSPAKVLLDLLLLVRSGATPLSIFLEPDRKRSRALKALTTGTTDNGKASLARGASRNRGF